MKVLLVDNYDSFTYNLVDLLAKITNISVDVKKNDAIDLAYINQFDKVILSPGAGVASESYFLLEILKEYFDKKSILGICLGHQALGFYFGAKLKKLTKPTHGVVDDLQIIKPSKIFKDLPKTIKIARYHSWILENIPNYFDILAKCDLYIMAIKHKKYDLTGVQFHPESFVCKYGKKILENWLFLN